jgi:hypothetical protein
VASIESLSHAVKSQNLMNTHAPITQDNSGASANDILGGIHDNQNTTSAPSKLGNKKSGKPSTTGGGRNSKPAKSLPAKKSVTVTATATATATATPVVQDQDETPVVKVTQETDPPPPHTEEEMKKAAAVSDKDLALKEKERKKRCRPTSLHATPALTPLNLLLFTSISLCFSPLLLH